MPTPRPRIILHVGRYKAGSTTIQHYCLEERDTLAARGVGYLLFGHLWDSVPGVAGVRTFPELVRHAAARPEQVHLVSNEFMSNWPDAYTIDAANVLAGCDVRILFYVRPYVPWFQSAYAETTRRAMSLHDIDGFLDLRRPSISMLPNLLCWARSFGWDRMYVRSLDPANLAGGDLLADFAQAIGADAPTGVAPQNIAPRWPELELIRAITDAESEDEWGGGPPDEVLPLAALMRDAASDVPATPYLTLAQRRSLTDLYNDDVTTIRRESGIVLPLAPEPDGAERPFVPAYEHIPMAVRERFLAAAASADFVARHPAAAARADRLRSRTTPAA